MMKKIKDWLYWNNELVFAGVIIVLGIAAITASIIVICVNICDDTATNSFNSIANPANPASPLNPINPASPLNHIR